MGYRVEGIPCADEYVPPVSLPKKMAPRTKRKSIKFEATVWAITEVMVQPLAKSRPAEEIAPVSAFLLETHSKMPDYMRFSIRRSEEHTSELQSLMRISYAVFCLKKNKIKSI